MSTLPYTLYRAEQVRALDRAAVDLAGIAGAELMERAGAAAFDALRTSWPGAQRIAVLCGAGNNGGDGYVIARLALQAGLDVQVVALTPAARLRGEARGAQERYVAAGGRGAARLEAALAGAQLVVDALLGTGLRGAVEGEWRAAIEAVNASGCPVLAVDIPSGLAADSGAVLGAAVRARQTISFIGLKQGLFTGQAREYCGRLTFAGLGVPAAIYGAVQPAACRCDYPWAAQWLSRRARSAHKGDFGHVLVIGGAAGMAGAAQLAGEAAARAGAGLVSVAAPPQQAASLGLARAELMVHGVADAAALQPLLDRASVLAVGPGLGQAAWGREMLTAALRADCPQVLDADALNLIAAAARPPAARADRIFTPHPGEAARLLGRRVAEIETERFAAAAALQARYGGVVLLKGAGSLVADGHDAPGVCTTGNPGMASGGMGDVLTGLTAGLLAQGLAAPIAARVAAVVHGAAADAAAAAGERGLLAGDVLAALRPLLNPGASA